MEITSFGASHLSRLIATKQISCQELMQATLRRIARVNPQVNAIVNLRDEAQLMNEAAAHDALLAKGQSKGWLHGIPIAVKDLAPAAGLPNTMGSPLLKDFIPKEDGLMVQRMRAAGCGLHRDRQNECARIRPRLAQLQRSIWRDAQCL